jgi:hypothetical protein
MFLISDHCSITFVVNFVTDHKTIAVGNQHQTRNFYDVFGIRDDKTG